MVACQLVIFDCDGVLVDSDRISLELQAQALTELGLPTSYEDCRREYMGIGMAATVEKVERQLGRPLPGGWIERLDAVVRSAFQERLTAVPGVIEALDRLPMATCVASSGTHDKIRFTLGLTGLYERFAGRIFSVEDVTDGKPAPDLFLHAAATVGVSAERSVVVEDSPAGIAGAKAAGMRSLGYAADTPSDLLCAADATFNDMTVLPDLILSVC